MNGTVKPYTIRSDIWREEPEQDNPFAAKAAFCCGYDVYGEMLGHARWAEMLFLLLRHQAASAMQAELLETLAVALANPGPREASVHAAMCGGVCGSTAASCLMAAMAVGAGQSAGAHEVLLAMEIWKICGPDLPAWRAQLAVDPAHGGSIWPKQDHAPGFDPHGVSTATPVKQTLACLARLSRGPYLQWLQDNLSELEASAASPLAMTGVAAAALSELAFTPEQGEMLYLLLRLPGAAAHALEQRLLGYKNFPFGGVELEQSPSRETQ